MQLLCFSAVAAAAASTGDGVGFSRPSQCCRTHHNTIKVEHHAKSFMGMLQAQQQQAHVQSAQTVNTRPHQPPTMPCFVLQVEQKHEHATPCCTMLHAGLLATPCCQSV
jgi:hypothetical protein